MKSFGASCSQIFRKLVVPSAMTWVVSGLKLNIGFALVGAIVGEYISSEAEGVSHMILPGSSNFTISLVDCRHAIVGVTVLVFNLLVSALERVPRSVGKVMIMKARKLLRQFAVVGASATVLLRHGLRQRTGSVCGRHHHGADQPGLPVAALLAALRRAGERQLPGARGGTSRSRTGGGGTQSWTAVLGGSADFFHPGPGIRAEVT